MSFKDFKYLPNSEKIIEYINSIQFTNYYKENSQNIKISSIDQKCTYDILYVISKCLINFHNINKTFISIDDFFNDEYTRNLLKDKTSSNGKAIVDKNKTSKEYDKLIGNILDTLAYANILEKQKYKRKKLFKIKNYEILKLLSNDEMLCVVFISYFVFNLIKNDNDIMNALNKLILDKYNNNLKIDLKNKIITWINKYSHRSTDNEQKNISLKIINPLYYLFELPKYNSNKNNRSMQQSLYDLSYFRVHVRDKQKDKNKLWTRKEFQNWKEYNNNNIEDDYYKSQCNKNKNLAKKNNIQYNELTKQIKDFISEYDFPNSNNILESCHVHHIYPLNFWDSNKIDKNLCHPNMIENLIILSQTEHYNIAHKKNNTKVINEKYLNKILVSQLNKINEYIKNNIGDYSYYRFYRLCCLIYNITPENINYEHKNEIIIKLIEEILYDKHI